MQLQNKIHSESGHHYLKNPAYGWVFAFLSPLRIEFSLLSGNSDFFFLTMKMI